MRETAPGRTRTFDHRIKSPLLYRLSYWRSQRGPRAPLGSLALSLAVVNALLLCAPAAQAQPAGLALGERPRLWASAEGGQRVRLLWTAPDGVTGYRLLRDGQPLAQLGADTVAYLDDTVRPGTRNRYELQPRRRPADQIGRAHV